MLKGKYYMQIGEYKKARNYFRLSEELDQKKQNDNYDGLDLLKAELELRLGYYDKAKYLALKAFNEAKLSEEYYEFRKSLNLLVKIREKQHNYKESLQTLKLVKQTEDSIFNTYLSLLFREKGEEFERDRIKIEYAKLKRNYESVTSAYHIQERYLQFLIAILSLLLVNLILLAIRYKLVSNNNFYLNKKVLILKKSRPYIAKNRLLSVMKGTK